MDGKTKQEYIEVFNNLIRGTPISWDKKVLPIIFNYLTETQFENSDKLINLIKQNPQLSNQFLADCIKYYCIKYNIFSLLYKNQTIFYYE